MTSTLSSQSTNPVENQAIYNDLMTIAVFAGAHRVSVLSTPLPTVVGSSAFLNISNLTTVNLPNVTSIATYVFGFCSSLSSISLPSVTIIGNSAFFGCTKLMSIYLLGSSSCALASNARTVFSNTPILNSTLTGSYGSVYVPGSLYDKYTRGANSYWYSISARIVSM